MYSHYDFGVRISDSTINGYKTSFLIHFKLTCIKRFINMRSAIIVSLIFTAISSNVVFAQLKELKPATPNASAEAIALLNLYYSISGKYILTGQHNYPNIKDRNSVFAAKYIGKDPVIYSTDWGFERDGNTDSYLARPDIVKEAIRQHRNGAIVTICWHAVPPTADEPVTFRPLPGADPDSLASIQGQLTNQQFQDVLTPGTALYKHWCSQVDSVAKYLKMLQEAHVPVLWRPYHEMNGNWFWWGGRQGTYSTSALYRQLFDRLVNYHKLNNLVWMWNVDRPHNEVMNFRNFYPGIDFFDIASLDVYHNDFNKNYYDSLLILAKGKPIAFGEVGNPPATEIIEEQPLWASYVVWAGMVRNTSKNKYDKILKNDHYLFQDDSNYRIVTDTYRKSCNLSQTVNNQSGITDLSGNWLFNEEKSSLGDFGASMLPYKMKVLQTANHIFISKTIILEYLDNRTDTMTLSLKGEEYKSETWNAPMITTANLQAGNDTLIIRSVVKFTFNNQPSESVTNEKWFLENNHQSLIIEQHSNSFWGIRDIKMVFDRIYSE